MPLFEIAVCTEAGSQWRFHGNIHTQDQFLQILFNDSRVTFTIEAIQGQRVIGMVQLWNFDTLSHNGHITAFLDPSVQGLGWPLEGILLFVQYAFPAFRLHKLYFESLEDSIAQYGMAVGSVLRREGILREHKWVFGRLVDCHILALYDEDVERVIRLLQRRMRSSDLQSWTDHSAGVQPEIEPIVIDVE